VVAYGTRFILVIGAQGTAHTLKCVIGKVKGVVHPPRAVIVPQMVIGIRPVYPDND